MSTAELVPAAAVCRACKANHGPGPGPLDGRTHTGVDAKGYPWASRGVDIMANLPGRLVDPKADRRSLPDVEHPRRGLTWITFQQGRKRLVVREHVVTWEPLRIAWQIQAPVLGGDGHRGLVRPLGIYTDQAEALRAAGSLLQLMPTPPSRRRRRLKGKDLP